MSVGREKERKTDDNRRHEERNDVTQDALGQWEGCDETLAGHIVSVTME